MFRIPLARAIAVLLVLTLPTACRSLSSGEGVDTPGRATHDRLDLLQGQVLLPPGSTLPEGARLQLRLVDRFAPAASADLLAQRELSMTTTPFHFELPFPRSQVRDISVYRLDVVVRDTAGRQHFVSDGEHPVNLGEEAEPTRIELMALEGVGGSTHQLDCGAFVADLRFDDPDLRLQLPDGSHALRRAHASVGHRYVGADAEIWLLDDAGRLQLGRESFDCRRVF